MLKSRTLSLSCLIALFCGTATLQAQTAPTPTRWGADDQAGASNTQTPAKALQAAKLIVRGKTYPLARRYDDKMPIFSNRSFTLTGTGGSAAGPMGEEKAVYNDDFLATQMGQVGTQFDALGHIGVAVGDEEIYYGGRKGRDVHGPRGLRQLGVEHAKPFFTRGILVDIEGYKKQVLPAGTEITIEDIQGALKAQGLSADGIGEGDVVIFHTGWGRYWTEDRVKFVSGSPGVGLKAATWLADKGVAILGADTMVVEPNPPTNPANAMPVHVEMIAKRGVFLLEGVATEELKKDKVWEFAFSYAPMPLVGATGAPGTALAIR